MIENDRIKADNEKRQKERVHAYKRLFQTDDGKIVLEDLESFCGFIKTSVNEQCPDAYQTFFAEGKRRVFLRINSFLIRTLDKEN